MSNRIRQAIMVGATGVMLIGGMTSIASATSARPGFEKATTAVASHEKTSQAKPCQRDGDCRRGYAAGYNAGRLSCQGGGGGGGGGGRSRSFGQYQRGFDLGFDRARSRFC